MLYFAYGSNLSSQRLRQRIDVKFVLRAYLVQHDLRFHKAGQDGSAKCDAFETGRDEDRIHGVIYEITSKQRGILDCYEGLGRGYGIKDVEVFDSNRNPILAQTYYATDINPALKPYSWYHHHVIFGASEFKLPLCYQRKLDQIQSIDDLDMDRHQHEMSIYKNS